MREQGAEIIDPIDYPANEGLDESELEVLLYEFKADLNAYLKTRSSLRVKSLSDIIAFNEERRSEEMPYFEQDIMTKAEAKGPLTESAQRRSSKEPSSHTRRRHRRRHQQLPAGRHRSTKQWASMANRLGHRRPCLRRLFTTHGHRRLPTRHSSSRVRSWVTRWDILLRPGMERTNLAKDSLRI